jgi:hypothetical protein
MRMKVTHDKPRLEGRFEWVQDKAIDIRAKFDKVAVHDERLLFISFVAFSQHVKAIRAGIGARLTALMKLRDIKLMKDAESIMPHHVGPSPSGYRIDAHRRGIRSVHAMFTARQQGLLVNDSDDALWQDLEHERFTTPLLRS